MYIQSFPTIMNPPSASSTSFSSPSKTYDVFISFRGNGSSGDGRFVSLLAKELSNAGLNIFVSDDRFKFEDDIVQKAILYSRYLVVVVTKDCTTSIRFLRELCKIMECREKDYEDVLIPLFYKDHPSCFVKELQDFGKSLDQEYNKEKGLIKFTKCGSLRTHLLKKALKTELSILIKSFSRKGTLRFQQTDLKVKLVLHNDHDEKLSEEHKPEVLMEVSKWKSALEGITHLPTTIFATEKSNESNIINEVKEIVNKIRDSPNLVGISPQLHQIHNLLDLGSNDVRFIGIVGMGGIGKTTIAKALYENLKPKFRYNHCFLRVFDHQKVVSLQNQILLRLCGKLDIVIKNEDHGAHLIKKYLRNKKVLIVLDGVDERRQIKELVGSPDWFSLGSRIIITTRNRNLCRQPKYKHKVFEYNVEFLDHDNAFLLFCKHAFGEEHHGPPDENFRDLAEEVVKMAEGHPSALIKIGSHLYGKDVYTWEENFSSLDKLLCKDLFHDILEKSYEGLDKDSQQVFLDLACFFHYGMSVDRVIELLESFGYRSPYNILQLLAERSLIQISYEKVQMHKLIGCMAQEIARGERLVTTQTRIWLREDARRVLHEKNGLKHVEEIVLKDMEEEELVLEAKSFRSMTELKLLEINNVKISEEITFLSNKLRLLNWDGYPSKYLPSTFQPPSLLELHLHNSQLERLWEGKKEFTWLKEIDVNGSENLVETPDFSKVPNLQRLILRNCSKLCVVHPSISTLNHLLLVDMENCINLKTFPSKLITSKRLQTLILSNSGLESFPDIEEKPIKSLTELHLDGTLIQDLPLSFGRLTHLTLLNLRDCTNLSSLPRSIRKLVSLQTLNLNGCKNLHQIPFTLGTIQSLTMLDIGGTTIDQSPYAIISLMNLETLNCERLSRNLWHSFTALGGNDVLPIKDLNLSDCKLEDEDIPDDLKCLSLLEILDLSKNSFVKLKESLTQLINLKALYLNDCINIQPQLLPKLPPSLQYVGGHGGQNNSQHHILQNDEGSYGGKSAYPPSNPPKTVTEIEKLHEVEEEENSREEVDNNKVNKMEKKISQLNSHCKFVKVCGKELVGMKEQLEEVLKLLDLKESNEVHFVWICGMAGIGKTTIAEVVYNEIVGKFQSSCFLHVNQRKNLISLQHQLLSQLLWKDNIEIRDEDYGAQMIEKKMKSKMALVVLDDIDEKRQVEVLVGSPDRFGHGSRVIFTTRNREIMQQLNYKDKMREYNVKLLSQENATLLFWKYAFENNDNGQDKNDALCTEIVKKVGGLPLALILIGSALRNKDEAKWKEMLGSLCHVEEEFFTTIASKRNQKNCNMKLGNVQVKNETITFQNYVKESSFSNYLNRLIRKEYGKKLQTNKSDSNQNESSSWKFAKGRTKRKTIIRPMAGNMRSRNVKRQRVYDKEMIASSELSDVCVRQWRPQFDLDNDHCKYLGSFSF